MKSIKGESLPINTVAIVILVIVTLLLITVTFLDKFGDSSSATNDISNQYTKNYFADVTYTTNEFDQTIININVNANKPVDVTHRIPKEVIEELTYENRDEHINSNLDYVILESDPLIAWHVEKPPANITYTINKKLTQNEINNFQTSVKESEKFNFLNYLVYFLIIVIILLVLEPILIKKKNKK